MSKLGALVFNCRCAAPMEVETGSGTMPCHISDAPWGALQGVAGTEMTCGHCGAELRIDVAPPRVTIAAFLVGDSVAKK